MYAKSRLAEIQSMENLYSQIIENAQLIREAEKILLFTDRTQIEAVQAKKGNGKRKRSNGGDE